MKKLFLAISAMLLMASCSRQEVQAIRSVEGTALKVTALTPTNGANIIEAIERTDKPFFVGVQFHPEVAVSKHVNKEADASNFMPYDEAMCYFRALMRVR